MTTLFEFAPTGSPVDGAAVPASAGLYDVVDAGVVYDTAQKFLDLAASAECPNPAGTTARTLEQQFTATTTRRIVRVMRVSALPASGIVCTLTRWRNGSSGILEVRLTAAGKIALRNNVTNTLIATASPTIVPGEWFRFEVDVNAAGSGSVTLRLYLDPDSSVPDATLGPFGYSLGAYNQIIDGVGTPAAALTVWVGYAADGDTENPSINRFAPSTPPPDEGGPATVLPDSGAAVNDGQSATSPSVAVVVPATAEVGDLALVCIACNTGSSDLDAPAGWTLLRAVERINSNVSGWIYGKVLAAGEPGSTVTWQTNPTVGSRLPAVIECWDGADFAELQTAVSTQAAAQAAHTAPALAAAEIGEVVQAFWIGRVGVLGNGPTLTPPGTHTAMRSSETNFGASPNLSVVSTRRTASAASVGEAEGGAVGTWSAAGTTGITFLIGIRPGGTGSGDAEGVRQYLVTAGGEVQLVSSGIV